MNQQNKPKKKIESPEQSWKVLRSIQEEYFSLVENNPLIRACKIIDESNISIPKNFLQEGNQILVQTRKGWKPSSFQYVEKLYEDVHSFWQANNSRLVSALKNLPSRNIHVDDTAVGYTIRRFGVLFDTLLISDQLLQFHTEYIAKSNVTNWQTVIITVVEAVYRQLRNKDFFLPENSGRPLAMIVPASSSLYSESKVVLADVTLKLTSKFISELVGFEISSIEEFTPYWLSRNLEENDLNPRFKKLLFSRFKATNFKDYQKSLIKLVYGDQGVDYIIKDPIPLQIGLDIFSRLREFERYACDAYIWGQEPEILSNDTILYDWWFQETAIESGYALGASFSENFLAKATSQTQALDFIQNVPLDNLLELLTTDPVLSLREDLSLSRINVKRNTADLSYDIDRLNSFVEERFIQFDEQISNLERKSKTQFRKDGAKLLAACGVSIAAALFPPLSAISLLWGGTVSDLIEGKKIAKDNLKNMSERPMATLVKWKNEYS